jgi:hypothetical protein
MSRNLLLSSSPSQSIGQFGIVRARRRRLQTGKNGKYKIEGTIVRMAYINTQHGTEIKLKAGGARGLTLVLRWWPVFVFILVVRTLALFFGMINEL